MEFKECTRKVFTLEISRWHGQKLMVIGHCVYLTHADGLETVHYKISGALSCLTVCKLIVV